MKLLIISNMPHHQKGGEIVGWGPTVQEIDHLSGLCSEIRHIACLHPGQAPKNALPYSTKNLTLIPVPPSGGETLADKLGILFLFPRYWWTIRKHLPWAEAVHVRCTANICMLAIVMLALRKHPKVRWIKYATNWVPDGPVAWSSRFQRWWLSKGYARGWVTINGEYPGQPKHVKSFLNPCLNSDELQDGRRLAAEKQMQPPLRMLFVGSMDANKGVLRALSVFECLRQRGVDVIFEVVGDGPERSELERRLQGREWASRVLLHGWQPRTALGSIYSRCHVFLLTSRSEGWPKVLSESMAYGMVPVASAISCIPDYFSKFKAGQTCVWNDIEGFADAISRYASDTARWARESENAMNAAAQFSYTRYLDEVSKLFKNRPID